MKKAITLGILSLLLIGCRADYAPGETIEEGTGIGLSQIKYVHDVKHEVGCWFYIDESGSSISCIPDKEYTN